VSLSISSSGDLGSSYSGTGGFSAGGGYDAGAVLASVASSRSVLTMVSCLFFLLLRALSKAGAVICVLAYDEGCGG
jgi:hypothetical protein